MQTIFQPVSGPSKLRARRTFLYFKHFADLFVRMAFHHKQVENHPVGFRHSLDQGQQVVFHQLVGGKFVADLPVRGFHIFQRKLVVMLVMHPKVTDSRVQHDSLHPRKQRTFKSELLQVGEDFRKPFYENIFRLLVRVRIPYAQPHQQWRILVV